jgi:hypothetical protein
MITCGDKHNSSKDSKRSSQEKDRDREKDKERRRTETPPKENKKIVPDAAVVGNAKAIDLRSRTESGGATSSTPSAPERNKQGIPLATGIFSGPPSHQPSFPGQWSP